MVAQMESIFEQLRPLLCNAIRMTSWKFFTIIITVYLAVSFYHKMTFKEHARSLVDPFYEKAYLIGGITSLICFAIFLSWALVGRLCE
jgi:hypothetical protein